MAKKINARKGLENLKTIHEFSLIGFINNRILRISINVLSINAKRK
jgi:hypothetical protein